MRIFNYIFERALVAYLSSHMVFFPLASYAAPLQTDGTTQTTIDAARNGVPVVNIANPNAKGLSHNKFSQYNVDKKGLILNNSKNTCVNTQLGGYIYGNKNLTGNAKVILNEVTSTNRSQLNGYTEIAGQTADLVIANPNGITVNGAGFINTNAVTLTTGRPTIINGALDSLDISGGDIAIEGAGLNNLGVSSTHLYTQYLRLNATLHAKDLDIKLGNNTIGYADKAIRASQNSGATGLLLDASALGGMYANRITLVGTDQGLGVNLPPEVVAATGDISISNDGTVTLQTINAAQQIDVNASDNIALDGQLYAGTNARLTTTANVTAANGVTAARDSLAITADTLNVGAGATLMAGLNSDSTQNTGGALSVSGNTLNNSGTLQSTNSLDLFITTALNNPGNLKAGGLLTANTATLDNSGGTILVNSADITTNHFENLNGSAAATNDFALTTGTIGLGVGGTSEFYAGNNLSLTVNDTALLNNHATSTIGAGNNLTLTTGGAFTNNADLLANGTLILNTKALTNNATMSGGTAVDITADSLQNNATGTISGGTGVSTINVAGNITNQARISAAGDLNVISGADVTNNGYFSTGNDLSISSNRLFNNTTLFAGNDMGLYTTATLRNNQNANIFAMNNMTMAMNSDGTGKTNLIVNDRGNIESLNGDIAINAVTFRNRTVAPQITGTYVPEVPAVPAHYVTGPLGIQRYVPAVPAVPAYISGVTPVTTGPVRNFCTNPWHCWNMVSTKTTAQTLLNNPVPATVYAGNNLILNADNITNQYSLISAQGDIHLAAAVVDNNPVDVIQVTTTTVEKWRNKKKCVGPFGTNCGNYTVLADTVVTTNETAIPVAASTIQAGGNITGNATNLNNGNIKKNVQSIAAPGVQSADTSTTQSNNTVTTDITLPSGNFGLFVTAQDPNSQYLIETNPEFALYSNFVSSDYMLDKIGVSPALTTKRLGDAFYENKLVRDSIFEQTGRRFLSSEIKDDNTQYQYLMDNAMAAQEDLLLIPGVSLTNAQIQGLKKDIVWMVEREVAGQKVLVPTVYIANPADYTIKGGMIIAGDELNIQVAELANAGLMEAGGDMNVTATDAIANYGGEMRAGEDLSLTATNDIENVSGSIAASNIALTSIEGDIINRRATEERSGSSTHGTYDYTAVGDAASIVAQNSLTLVAADAITIEGSNLEGGDISLNAETVDITTTVENIDYAAKNGDLALKEQSTTHYGSNVAGENVTINSRGKTTVAGSTVNAEGQLNVEASELDIVAVNNTTYSEYKDSSSGMFSSETRQTKQATSTNIGSSLTGGNISLTTTEGDITVVGSGAAAEDTLALNSAGNINVQAGYDGEMNESRTESSGFGGGDFYSESIDVEGRMATTAVLAQLSGNRVEMNAEEDINLIGTDVAANAISGSAENINIENVYDEETTWSKHEKMSMSLGDVAKAMSDPSALIKTEGGKASIKLGEVDYSNIENSTTTKTVVGSSMNADNITLNASSDDGESGNISITGSDLAASDTIALLATGDVGIKEAKSTQESKTKEQTGHGELNLTVKNEYVEIATALETAKAAEQALEKNREAYKQYQKELAKQQEHLAQLKQDLADGKLGIEQSDIDELATFIDDLKGDDAYYQANIALAVADLATKTAAVAKQMATAAASSGTYGFNVGLEMDLDLLEKRYGDYKEQSVASNLVANNITIQAGGDTTIRGSNLAADDIGIETENLNILASRDINTSSNSSEHMNTNVSMSVYGGSGASVSASADRSQGGSTDIIHTNSQLQGNNIRLKTRDTTTIAGANVAAADTLNIETKHLNVESVQDSHESRSAGEGINVSGAAGSVPGSGGINGSVSHSRSRETVLTTLTGGNVDINVAEDTTLTGATIAAIDENGEDNGQLNFQTGTLQVNALSNTGYSTSTSANIGAGQTVSIDASSDTSHSKTKTLGTIGEGNIHVANIDDSDTKLLNRDVTDNEVDIYSIESHKGLKGSLDTRFLTEDGRKDVLEDIKRSELLGSALLDVVTEESVRFQDTMQHIGDIQKDLDVQKLLANRDDGVNAKILNDLANATLEEKQQAINAYAAAYAEVYHITIDQALVVTVNAFVGGAHANSGEGSTLYVNDYAQNNALDYTNTLGHEVAHAQMAQDSSLDRGDARLNEEYANLRGEYAADNYEFSFSQNDYGPINTGNTNAYVGNATSETARNNNTQYYSEDRKNLDFSCEMASPTGSCAQLMHDSAITANMMVGNKERAAELIEADVIASLMRTGRTEQLEKVLADASPGAVKEALQLQMSMAQEDKAALAAGGIVLAIVAAPAIPEVLAGMAATGRMAAAEIASFASNPVAYCQLNPALCLSIAEEAGYTSAGATTASSMVPHVPASGVRQAAGEAVAGKVDDVAKDVLSTAKRQGPYDPNKARADLEDVYGAENVTSTTNPKDPLQRVNSDPEKGVEVINGANGSKAVRVEYNDPVTGETVAANVPYNNRGLPVFDDQAKFTTNIDTTKNYDAQFSQATRDLRDAINSGQVDASQFTELQMQQIQAGKSKIKDYTWHHNADSNNMQLVPTNVHEAVNHVGQKSLSSGQ